MISILLLCIITVIGLVNGHEHGAYYHGSSNIGDGNEDWMAKLCDGTKISSLSIPGTHDTMADDNDGDMVDTQVLTLMQQLVAGIRSIDIRLVNECDNTCFAIYHGDYFLSKFFGGVLTKLKTFLTEYPTEFILMRVLKEHDSDNLETFIQIFDTYYNDNDNVEYFYQPTTFGDNPTVGQLRGKILVIQWFNSDTIYGLRSSNNIFSTNSKFALCTPSALYSFWINKKSSLEDANSDKSDDKIYVTFLSGSQDGSMECVFGDMEPLNLVFPYFVASGHSNPANGAPRQATGYTTPGWNSKWPDFPRTTCTGNWLCVFLCDDVCTISYEGTNILAYQHMSSYTFVGIVMMDFPGRDIIDRIITKNVWCTSNAKTVDIISDDMEISDLEHPDVRSTIMFQSNTILSILIGLTSILNVAVLCIFCFNKIIQKKKGDVNVNALNNM
eukprot:248190_1